MELEQEGVTGWHVFHRGAERSENEDFADGSNQWPEISLDSRRGEFLFALLSRFLPRRRHPGPSRSCRLLPEDSSSLILWVYGV